MIQTTAALLFIALFLGLAARQVWVAYGRPPRMKRFFTVMFALAWVPTFVTLRDPSLLVNHPQMLPIAVVMLTFIFFSVIMKLSSASPDLNQLLKSHFWRAPVGLVFLFALQFGMLETSFAVSAGSGDLLVGLFAAFIARYSLVNASSRAGVLAWSFLGLFDLCLAVFLAVAHLIPWFGVSGVLPTLGMLPFFGLPLFFSTSFLIIKTVLQKGNQN